MATRRQGAGGRRAAEAAAAGDMGALVASLASDPKLASFVRHRGLVPGSDPVYAEPASGWPPGAREAALKLGAARLYSHQAAALDLVAAGNNVLLATPTASGKTLAYVLAFLARRALDPAARAVFVYPLKALARDQLAAIRRALAPLGLKPSEAAEVYDGDTPETSRRRIRHNPPAVVVTNPDMLHLGILPSHETWRPFLEHLQLVAVDEAHVYRGIFGAHAHHVLRRLFRLARLHGGDPLIVAGSATIGEPRAFAETLFGEPCEVVRECGAPRTPRHTLFLAPDAVSPYTIAVHVLARAVDAGRKTIAFTKARRVTELMHQWLRQSRPDLAARVAGYRSGYLPEERREIERRLFSGELEGVVSTSALEAGIDVGGLDVCILVGYPGSLATSWQRIGRAGRQDRESLAVLVALPDALDRYVVAHPEHFFSGEFERVVLDPDNDTIADAHLVAAGSERSLGPADVLFLQGESGAARARRLVDEGRLLRAEDDDERWFTLRSRPQRDIPLRSAGQQYELKRAGDGRPMGTLDESRAWFEGHPGAIYLHMGQTFRSLSLDADTRTITLEPADVDYYTQVYARKETEILERKGERAVGPARLCWGRVKVTTFVEGYGRRRMFTQEEISRHPLEAPPMELETVAFWLEMPNELLEALVDEEFHPAGSLHAVEHAMIGLFPLQTICDRWDLGGISYALHPQIDAPAIFVYDGWPGGVGLAEVGFARAEDILAKTRDLVASCPCEDGCPACIQSPKCGSGNRPLDKEGGRFVLEILTGARPLGATRATRADVEARLTTHRRVLHPGARGGVAAPEGFFAPPPDEDRATAAAADEGAPAAAAGGAASPVPARGAEPAVIVPDEEDLSMANPPEGTRAASRALGGAWRWDFPDPVSLLGPDEGRWIFFDVETLRGADDVGGWNYINKMGLALAVTLDGATGAFRTWREDEAPALIDALLAADRVVGFNQDRFDLTVLSAYPGGRRLARVRSLDLLKEIQAVIGRRLGLAHLAEATLGAGKSADGLQSLVWVREGRFDLIERYCRDDVLLTAALWAHGRARGHVLARDKGTGRVLRIPVSW